MTHKELYMKKGKKLLFIILGVLLVFGAIIFLLPDDEYDDDYMASYHEHYGYYDEDYYDDYDDEYDYYDEYEYEDDYDDDYYDDYDDSFFGKLSADFYDEDYDDYEEDNYSSNYNDNESYGNAYTAVAETAPVQNEELTGKEADWTVLVYLCGSDLESEYGEGIMDIEQMLQAKFSSNVNVVIETGGASKWHGYNISNKKLERLVLKDGKVQKVQSLPNASMGKPETLGSFIAWAKEKYPAKRYVLDFWNHGGGSASGVCFDELFEEKNDLDSLSFTELKKAFSQGGVNFDIIIFDACLSATIEMADTLAPFAKYMVASEEVLLGGKISYDKWITTLSQTPDIASEEVAVQIAKYYGKNMKDTGNASTCTMAAIDLSKIENVKTAFEAMAAQMTQKTQNATSFKNLVKNGARGVKYGSNSEQEGYTNMIDLGEFAEGARNEVGSAADVLIGAIKKSVLYEVHGASEGNSSGLAVYYPIHYDGETDYYAENVDNRPYLQYLDAIIDQWKAPSWVYTDRRMRSFKPLKRQDNKVTFETYYKNPDTDPVFALKITNAADCVESVTVNIYWLDEESGYFFYLGNDNDMYVNGNEYTDNFDASWFSIADCYINAELVSVSNKINTYSAPINLNGKETNLRFIYDTEKDKYTILGAYDGTKKGAASKGIRKFKEGDKIEFLFTGLDANDIDENTSDEELDEKEEELFSFGECVYKKGLNVERMELMDGTYVYEFEVATIFGTTETSDIALMEYKDGELFMLMEEEEE